MAPRDDGGSSGTPSHPVITAPADHEIKLKPEQIKKLAEILTDRVCEPLEHAAHAIHEAEEKAGFENFGLKFGSTEIAHIICVQITHQNVESFSEKTVKEDIGEKLHITAKTWHEAEHASKTKAE